MTSEIRSSTLKNRVGLGTVSFTNTGIVVSGIVTATSFSGTISGTTGTFSGDVDVDGHTNLDNVSIAGVTTITGSGNALEIVGGLVRSRNTAAARFVANNGSAEGYFGWSSGVLTVGQAAATLSLEATGSNHIQLKTNGSERLRITEDGDVFINRTSALANAKLSIQKDTSQEGIGIQLNQSSGITTSFTTFNSAGNQTFSLAHETDGTPDLILKLKHSTDGAPAEKVRITSSGAVGINTTVTAATKLQVQSDGTSNTAGANVVARFQSNGSGRDATIQLSDNVANSATISMLSSALILKQSGTETVHIDSSGRVMIGTSSAGLATGDEFTIHTSAHTGMTIRSGNSHEGNIFFGDSDYGSAGVVRYDHSANAMIFKTNSQGTDKLRINSNGDITTTGQASFSRQNAGFTARAGDSVTITRASGTPLEINRTGSDGQMISLFDDNSQEAGIGLSSGSLIIGVPNSSNPKLTISSSTVSLHSTIGHLLLGTDTARSINSHNAKLQVTGTSYSHSTVSIINNEANANGAYLFLGKQRSGAVGGNTAVEANDIIGELRFNAGDGTDMENYVARIQAKAQIDATSNNTSGYLDFYTTRQNGSSEHKMRMTQNSNHSHVFSMGTSTTHLNNASTPDRTSVKIGGLLHLEGPFGHNATPGMYYNCYSGGNDLFYRGTGAPSGGDRRPAAYGQKFGGHYFYGDTSSTAWTAQQQITTMQTNMTITSQGYVLKPAHPAFQVRRTNSVSATQNPLVYDTVYLNTGSHYKSSGTDQGKFVAPVAGVYFFYWTAIKNALDGQVTRLYINKNGSRIYGSYHLRLQEDGNYANGSTQATVSLAAGDKVHIELANGAVHGSEYTQFGGYLIG